METDLRICGLGVGGIGKTTFNIHFVCAKFEEDVVLNYVNELRKQITVNDKTVTIDIEDFCDQDEFPSMKEHCIKRADGFCVFFSLTDRASYEKADEKIQLVYKTRETTDLPMVLIGTKADLVDEQVISIEEGTELANNYGIPFFLTSAKTGQNVESPFFELARLILAYRSLHPPKEKKDRKAKCLLM